MREQKQDNFIEYKEKVRICDSELLKFINENYSLTVGALYLLERQQINIIIHRLKEIESVTIRQIVRVTGVSKYLVEKA